MRAAKKNLIIVLSAIIVSLIALPSIGIAQDRDSVYLYYGNLDGSALDVSINERISIDLYIFTPENAYIGDCCISLGTDDRFIDSLLSESEGMFYYPFTEWDVAMFTEIFGSPPNPEGWSSQSILGFCRIAGMAPWLHYDTPQRATTFVVKTANDPNNVGAIAMAVGPGMNSIQGPTNCGDTLGDFGYEVIEQFSPFHFDGGGYVQGVVSNSLGESIEGVSVVDQQTGFEYITGEDGYYLHGLYPGIHDITFSHPDYRDTTINDVDVMIDNTTELNVILGDVSSIDNSTLIIPENLKLGQNYPNPFNAQTMIIYSLPKALQVKLDIYNILGRHVETLVDEHQQAGCHEAIWNAQKASSGIYFYSIQAGKFKENKKMILLK